MRGIVVVVIWLGATACDRPADQKLASPPAPPAAPPVTRPRPSLSELRAAHPTKLVRRGPSPEEVEPFDVPGDARVEMYRSGALKLRCWISPDPKDGVRRPAVVYLHGNFSFEPRHWDAAKPYRDAGFVTMTPMLRGENGCAANFELFYGEVDDVVAAAEHLSKLDYVDPNRIYLCGHSVGGTLTMLASMVPSKYRAAAALSGAPDVQERLKMDGESYRVFDARDPQEMRLRTPRFFVADIRCPLFMMDGDQEYYYIPDTRRMAEDARRAGKRCTFETVPGDHRGFKMEAIRRTVALFRAER